MAKTYGQQMKEALLCNTREEADKYLETLAVVYSKSMKISTYEAKETIKANLKYLAGYYDDAVWQKIKRLFF